MPKPNNYSNEDCESKSSNCVIWAGPRIDCINLCPGDSITVAIDSLATKLCQIMTQLDITNYDLTCLGLTSDATPKDFSSFITMLIQKVCAASGSIAFTGRSANTLSTTNDIVNLAKCFQYNDPSNGDLVITSTISDYVQRIGITVCNLITQISSQQEALISLTTRVSTLENNKPLPYQLPNLVPVCIGSPLTALSLNDFVAQLEVYVCQLSQAIGTSNKIYTAITTPPTDLNTAKALGTGGGTMGEKAGWISNVKDLSDSTTNMWLTILDLRSAVRNIQQNCCNTLCDGIKLTFSATLDSKILKLFFTGTIPSNLISCAPAGALFKIEDLSGNFVNISVDIKGNMNNVSGYAADLTSSPLNFADSLKVTTLFCFNDPTTSSMCQNFLETIVDNNMNCPVLTVSPSTNSVSYQFSHTAGTLTYSVQLFNSLNVMVQSKNVSASAPIVISDLFAGLTSGTSYKIRVSLITALSTKTCPFTPFMTIANPCPPVNAVSAIINII